MKNELKTHSNLYKLIYRLNGDDSNQYYTADVFIIRYRFNVIEMSTNHS